MNRMLIREQKAHAERQKKTQAEAVALVCFASLMRSPLWHEYLLVAKRRAFVAASPVLVAMAVKHPLFTAVQAVRARVAASHEEQSRRVALEAKMKTIRDKREAKKTPSQKRREARRAAERASKQAA